MDAKYPQTGPTIILELQKNAGNLSLRRFCFGTLGLQVCCELSRRTRFEQVGIQEPIDTDDFGKPLAPDGLAQIIGKFYHRQVLVHGSR